MRNSALALATGLFAAACSGSGPTAPPPPPPGPPAVATVSLSRDTATLIPRQTLQFAATVKDANGNSLSGRSVAWGSANPSVATVATDGVVTAVAAGSSVVTATSEGKSGQATITVKDGAVLAAAGGIAATGDSTARLAVPAGALTTETTITVAPVANPPAHPRLVAGTAFEFGPSVTLATPGSIRIRFANAVLAVSADTNRLRLHRFDAGGWTEVPGGTVDLANRAVTGAITSLGTFAVVELTPLPVAAVTLAPDTATLVPQQTRQLIPTTRDGQGGELRNRTVTWASGTPAVVTVDAAGLVTAVAAGTATVTATSEGKSGVATITVKDGAVVGAAGGVVTSAGGAAQVTFPPGALPNSRAITITPAANPGADPRLVTGTAFEFEPSGGFQQPVTIKISYAGTTVPAALDPATLRLNRLTNGVWVEVPGSTVDQVARTVTGQTSSFSTYAVVGGVPPQQVVITFIHAFDPGAGNTCSTPAPCGLGPLRSWTVPADVYTATVELWGASGGGPLGRGLGHGKGGKTTATITVVPGEQYQVRLGNPGGGSTPNFNGGAGGGPSGGYCGAFDFSKTPAGFLNCVGSGFGGGGGPGGAATDRLQTVTGTAPGVSGEVRAMARTLA